MSRLEWYYDDAERDKPLMIPEIHNHYIRKRYPLSIERYNNPQSPPTQEDLGSR